MTLNTSYETVTVWLFKTHHFGLRHHRCFLLIFFNKNLSVEKKNIKRPSDCFKKPAHCTGAQPKRLFNRLPCNAVDSTDIPNLRWRKNAHFRRNHSLLGKRFGTIQENNSDDHDFQISPSIPAVKSLQVPLYSWDTHTHVDQAHLKVQFSKWLVADAIDLQSWEGVVLCLGCGHFDQANQSSVWQIGRLSKWKKSDQVNKKGQAYQLKMICKSFTK